MDRTIFVSFMLGLCAAPVAGAGTIYVNGATGDDAWSGLCETWDGGTCGPKKTIQAGIDVAQPGETVLVAAGVYAGFDFEGKAITVSGASPSSCKAGRVEFHSGETHDSLLTGFTFWSLTSTGGGAILCSSASPTIKNCLFYENQAIGSGPLGGAVLCTYSNPVIESCSFFENYAGPPYFGYSGQGGAICCLDYCTLTITDCQFLSNQADSGGAIYCYGTSSAKITDCVFRGNGDWFGYWAAAVTLPGGELRRCIFEVNARSGSKSVVGCGDVTVADCVFVGNAAEVTLAVSGGRVWDCAFVGNVTNALPPGQLAALECWGGAEVRGCTVAWNDYGLQADGTVDISDCVIWGNQNQQVTGIAGYTEPYLKYSDIQNGAGHSWFGKGCIDLNPKFVSVLAGTWTSVQGSAHSTTFSDAAATWDPGELVGKFLNPNVEQWRHGLVWENTATTVTIGGDFRLIAETGDKYEVRDLHLTKTSPCYNAGGPQSFGLGQLDLDGEPRVMGGRVDMGADEFTDRPFVFGDMDCDGVRNAFDIDPFVLALTDPAAYQVAYPDCNLLNGDCNSDGVLNAFDIDPFVELLTGE